MTSQATITTARAMFAAWDAAVFAHDFRGAPAPVPADFGYCHGWVAVDGASVCRETAFPEITFPRFPACQGLND